MAVPAGDSPTMETGQRTNRDSNNTLILQPSQPVRLRGERPRLYSTVPVGRPRASKVGLYTGMGHLRAVRASCAIPLTAYGTIALIAVSIAEFGRHPGSASRTSLSASSTLSLWWRTSHVTATAGVLDSHRTQWTKTEPWS